jgi:tRNA threonylcarbamoyladenosine biosynthesis protein TsaE
LEFHYTLENIDRAVIDFWNTYRNYHLFAFNGDMGAGKTTFIHRLCDHLHVQDAVSSPTFALINEYHFMSQSNEDRVIYHMDWFRLKDTPEAINAGMEDCIDMAIAGRAVCFIEWPQKARELLRKPYVDIQIESTSELNRVMTTEIISG